MIRGPRKALEGFLLRSPTISPKPNPKLDALVKSTITPMINESWMPDPLQYRHLNLNEQYLEQLEKFDARNEFYFQTRLLLLQAFMDESRISMMKTPPPPQSARQGPSRYQLTMMLSNARLSPIGRRVFHTSLSSLLLSKYPQLDPSLVRYLHVQLSDKTTLSSITESIKDFNSLILTNPDKNNKSADEVQSNALLACIGALYLDQGLTHATRFVLGPVLESGLERYMGIFMTKTAQDRLLRK